MFEVNKWVDLCITKEQAVALSLPSLLTPNTSPHT